MECVKWLLATAINFMTGSVYVQGQYLAACWWIQGEHVTKAMTVRLFENTGLGKLRKFGLNSSLVVRRNCGKCTSIFVNFENGENYFCSWRYSWFCCCYFHSRQHKIKYRFPSKSWVENWFPYSKADSPWIRTCVGNSFWLLVRAFNDFYYCCLTCNNFTLQNKNQGDITWTRDGQPESAAEKVTFAHVSRRAARRWRVTS